jgi:predicted porin
MTSLKKLTAVLAVSLPLATMAQAPAAAPAAAPAPLYQWYGTFNVNAQYFEVATPFKASPTATPVNVAGRFGVSIDSSNIGVRGGLDVEHGLKVVYQCETQASLDGLDVRGLCNRNSRLCLTNPTWGTLFYGNWDSPYKAVWYGTKGDDAFANTDVFDAAALMGSPGFRTRSTAGVSTLGFSTSGGITTFQTDRTFNVRAANSIAYHSPKFMGAQLKAQVSPNENGSLDNKITPMLWSVGLNYDRGPLSVFAAWERHDDWSGITNIAGTVAATGQPNIPGGTANTVDQGLRVGAGYELASPFGATTLGAVWEWLEYDFANPFDATVQGLTGTFVRYYKRTAVMANLKHRMGNHEFRARYTYADNGDCSLVSGATCNFDIGKGAQNYALGYAYYLSKAAQVYAYWTMIENERTATYTFATAGPNAVTAAWGAGGDPAGAGLGIRYAF